MKFNAPLAGAGYFVARCRWKPNSGIDVLSEMKDLAPIIDPGTCIGHVHLKVADMERAVAFYTDILGFQVVARMGNSAAFLSAGGYHHHIGLNVWESKNGAPPPRGTTGLYHFAILLPSRIALAQTLRRLLNAGWRIDGAADHGVSEAIYFRDPDQNGIEIYCDRPRSEWPTNADGSYALVTEPLDLNALLREAD